MNVYGPKMAGSTRMAQKKILAWGVHLFTASGAVWGLLAILSIMVGQWTSAFFWMGAALFVDSFDGMLARLVGVQEVLPDFDGALLDNMIDYLNYVVVPALLLYQADIMPAPLVLVGSAAVLLASAYQFCQADAKTADHFFLGFPSYWNIVVFYLMVLGFNSWVNLAIILFLCGMVFVPFKYVYPSRTRRYYRLTLVVTALWGATSIGILIQFPSPHPWLVLLSLATVVYYLVIGIVIRRRDRLSHPRRQARGGSRC